MIFLTIISLIFGVAITLITGFFSNQEGIVGAGRWGYPLHWLSRMVTSPEYSSPYDIVWSNFVIDIAIWTVIIFIVLMFVYRKDLFKK